MKNRKAMKRLLYTNKLILYNLLIMVAILACVLSAFFSYLVSSISRETKNEFETLASKTVGQFDNLLFGMDKTALQIAANPSIVRYLMGCDRMRGSNYFEREPLVATSVIKLLDSYNFKREGNTRICIYNNYDDFVYSSTTMTTTSAVGRFFQSPEFERTRRHFDGNNVFFRFIPPRSDLLNDSGLPSPDYFAIVREVKNYLNNSQKCGYVEVQQSVGKINQIFDDLGPNCYAAVFDENGSTIYRSPSLTQEAPGETLQFLKDFPSLEIGSGVKLVNGQYVGCYATADLPLRVVFIKGQKDVEEPLRRFSILLFAASLALLAVAACSEAALVRHLSRPLVELTRSIRNIDIDNLNLQLEDAGRSDELQQLNTVFNRMLGQLREAIDRQLISETNELKSHLFALQSQMNPHFMYNILAIISMEATADGNDKIVDICSHLTKMLSFSSSMENGFCVLEREVAHAENYLALMKQRYEELFEYEITYSAEMKELMVPKLIVQPICENCFKHAFHQREPVWRIWVRGWAEGDRWYISVQDNGPGFPQDFLRQFEEMERTLTLSNVWDALQKIQIGGLCIPNIYMRLMVCYKSAMICKICNTENGAMVTLGGVMDDTCASGGGRIAPPARPEGND